jgi:hypothetical protein
MPAASSVPPQPSISTEVIQTLDNTFQQLWRNYFVALDNMLRTGQYGPLPDAADDSAAATAGVPVNGFYRNGNVVQVRIT